MRSDSIQLGSGLVEKEKKKEEIWRGRVEGRRREMEGREERGSGRRGTFRIH